MEAVARAIGAEALPKPASVALVCARASGGIAGHVISLLAGLHRDNYQLTVVCEPQGPVAGAARERGIAVHGLRGGAASGPSWSAVAALQVRKACAAAQAQIVHTHSFRAGLAGALALAMPLGRGVRLVATVHNFLPGAPTMRARQRRQRWALGLLFRRASRLITVSDALRAALVAAVPELEAKTVTIPNGVDTRAEARINAAQAREGLGLPQEALVVGMLARLAPQKGVPEFIQACRLVADAHPTARFALAGDGPLREQAEHLRQQLGLGETLSLVCPVPWARDFVEAVDVLVVASTSEGSSVAAMEAMAAAKPVVATAVGGVPEVVADGETGLLVAPGDPSALAEAIVRLLSGPEQRQEMGERGRQRAAQRFDIRQMIERTKEVYADVLREEIEGGPRR